MRSSVNVRIFSPRVASDSDAVLRSINFIALAQLPVSFSHSVNACTPLWLESNREAWRLSPVGKSLNKSRS